MSYTRYLRYTKYIDETPDLFRGSPHSAGLDLCNMSGDIVIPVTGNTVIDTGINVEIPEGFYGQVTPRSSIGFKLHVISHVGIIDSDYRGPVKVKLFNLSQEPVHLAHKERVAQLVITPFASVFPELVDSLDETERGVNGCGSTGRF